MERDQLLNMIYSNYLSWNSKPLGTTVVTKDTGFYYKYNSSTVNGSELKIG